MASIIKSKQMVTTSECNGIPALADFASVAYSNDIKISQKIARSQIEW
jgi:hypothetical protein